MQLQTAVAKAKNLQERAQLMREWFEEQLSNAGPLDDADVLGVTLDGMLEELELANQVYTDRKNEIKLLKRELAAAYARRDSENQRDAIVELLKRVKDCYP